MASVNIKEKSSKLIELTGQFCTDKLNSEYGDLCKRMVQKLGRNRNIPFRTGKLESWAASIIHALGSINFLFDKTTSPYVSFDEIADYFHVGKSTISTKSKAIRDLLDIWHFNDEFSTGDMKENNPFNDMVMVDGFIVQLSSLPQDVQYMVRKARAEGQDIELHTKR